MGNGCLHRPHICFESHGLILMAASYPSDSWGFVIRYEEPLGHVLSIDLLTESLSFLGCSMLRLQSVIRGTINIPPILHVVPGVGGGHLFYYSEFYE